MSLVMSCCVLKSETIYASGNQAYAYIKSNGLHILEIQPKRSFILSKSSFPAELRGHITITQMSVNELNSKIDEINGKYDVVYLGGYRWGTKRSNYKKYTNVFTYKKYDKQETVSKLNNSTAIEYYAGNDMTHLKARKIEEFIASGQLFYMDEGIFDKDGYSKLDIPTDTKLYSHFSKFTDNHQRPNNVRLVDWTSISGQSSHWYSNVTYYVANRFRRQQATGLINTYYASIKRPNTTIIKGPKSYKDGYEAKENKPKSLTFNMNIQNPNPGNVTINLYVDINGDGIFKEDELKKQIPSIRPAENISINYPLPYEYTGLHPWKLEIVDDETKAKYYQTGAAKFKGNEKIEVRVLQIRPQRNNFSITTDVKDGSKDLLESDDYKIITEVVKVDDFLNRYGDPKYTINGVYDMIIIGFYDCFNNDDFSVRNATIDNRALTDIKKFIDTYQSVMFTHDVIGYYLSYSGRVGQTKNLTDWFRDIIGQNIYTTKEEYSGHTPEPLPDPRKQTYGYTTLALDRYHTNKMGQTTKTFKLNEGLITMYPYELGNISVANTHSQYYQLDLEDEQVIPWYTLDSNEGTDYLDKYDGRNNYYTYTKGNITFSGTGHSRLNTSYAPVSERKLFVNTMIKATRGANHAPTINVSGITDNQLIPTSTQEVIFTLIVNDLDDEGYIGSHVYVDKNNNGSFEEDEIIRDFTFHSPDNDRTPRIGDMLTVTIERNEIQQLLDNCSDIRIKISAVDPKDARSHKDYTLKVIDVPMLDLGGVETAKGCLVGDAIDIETQLAIRNSGDLGKNFTIAGITMNKKIYDSSLYPLDLHQTFHVTYNNWIKNGIGVSMNNIENLTIRNGVANWTTKNYPMRIVAKSPGKYYVDHDLDYYYEGFGINTDPAPKRQIIDVKDGYVEYSFYDAFHRGVENVKVSIGSREAYSNNSGNVKITHIPTGTYTVDFTLPDGYSFKVNTSNGKKVSLNYDHSHESIEYELVNIPFKDVKIMNDPSNTDITVTTTSTDETIGIYQVKNIKALIAFTLLAKEANTIEIPLTIAATPTTTKAELVSVTLSDIHVRNSTTNEDYTFECVNNKLKYVGSKLLKAGTYTAKITINLAKTEIKDNGFKEKDKVLTTIPSIYLSEPNPEEPSKPLVDTYTLGSVKGLAIELLESKPEMIASTLLGGQNKHKEIIKIDAKDKYSRIMMFRWVEGPAYVSGTQEDYINTNKHLLDTVPVSNQMNCVDGLEDKNIVGPPGYTYQVPEVYISVTKNGTYLIQAIDESGMKGYYMIEVDHIISIIPNLT